MGSTGVAAWAVSSFGFRVSGFSNTELGYLDVSPRGGCLKHETRNQEHETASALPSFRRFAALLISASRSRRRFIFVPAVPLGNNQQAPVGTLTETLSR